MLFNEPAGVAQALVHGSAARAGAGIVLAQGLLVLFERMAHPLSNMAATLVGRNGIKLSLFGWAHVVNHALQGVINRSRAAFQFLASICGHFLHAAMAVENFAPLLLVEGRPPIFGSV
jgi:hypothetical protein